MSLFVGSMLGGLVYTLAKTNESMKIDEQTQKKYARAFEKRAAAEQLVRNKQNEANNSLTKVANRKTAILSTSMAEFLELYEKIIKINFIPGDGILELSQNVLAPVKYEQLRHMANKAISPMTDKEIVVSYLLKGIGGAMVDDSKRKLAMANSEMKLSNVVYSQAETFVVALEAIVERGNRLAKLLAKMNLLFSRSIKTSSEIIEKNGIHRNMYNLDERQKIMTCINFADAIKKIIDVPLLDHNGEITQESLTALQTGNDYLEKLKNL